MPGYRACYQRMHYLYTFRPQHTVRRNKRSDIPGQYCARHVWRQIRHMCLVCSVLGVFSQPRGDGDGLQPLPGWIYGVAFSWQRQYPFTIEASLSRRALHVEIRDFSRETRILRIRPMPCQHSLQAPDHAFQRVSIFEGQEGRTVLKIEGVLWRP